MHRSKDLNIIFCFMLVFILKVEASPNIEISNENVFDKKTGLVWAICINGLSGNNCEKGKAIQYKWMDALNACRSPYRLPSVNELKSLVDKTNSQEPIDSKLFPKNNADAYWSSTYSANHPNMAFYVKRADGLSASLAKTRTLHVRCVTDH